MRKLFATVIICLSFAPTNIIAQDNWSFLFNGKNLSNWRVLNGDASFKIEDGIIVGVSKSNTPNTFLATKKQYGDFILEYEAMMEDGLNSGVQIRSHSSEEYKNGRVHGYQIELDSSPRSWTAGIYDEARSGWLYNLEYNPPAKTAYKHGAWNQFRVEAIGNNIRVWLNGVFTADLIDNLDSEGFIALQVHSIGKNKKNEGKTIKFRNIRIATERLDIMKTVVDKPITQVSYLLNQLTEKETVDGWKLLWDGKTTAGWRGARLQTFPEKGWAAEDGILKVLKSGGGEAENGGDIVTIDQYKNFIVEVDFKLTEGANSGLKYFVDTELNQGKGSSIGCEFQMLDDKMHPDAKKGTDGNRTLASLYDLITADATYYAPHERPKRVNTYGWNRAKVIVEGAHVQHFLNGIKVIDYTRGSQVWRALVARSKYAVWPNFGERDKGHILLQDHGDEVHFKNIKIKELN